MESIKSEETVVISRSELIRLLLELERRDVCVDFLLNRYMECMETMARKLERVLTERTALDPKMEIFNFVMSNDEWAELVTDERVRDWETAFETRYGLKKREEVEEKEEV